MVRSTFNTIVFFILIQQIFCCKYRQEDSAKMKSNILLQKMIDTPQKDIKSTMEIDSSATPPDFINGKWRIKKCFLRSVSASDNSILGTCKDYYIIISNDSIDIFGDKNEFKIIEQKSVELDKEVIDNFALKEITAEEFTLRCKSYNEYILLIKNTRSKKLIYERDGVVYLGNVSN